MPHGARTRSGFAFFSLVAGFSRTAAGHPFDSAGEGGEVPPTTGYGEWV